MTIARIGIDLAKNVFEIHGVDGRDKVVIQKTLRRGDVSRFLANVPPCQVAMEACSGAHYWARKLEGFGHEVKLISPQFVKPYVKTNKSDANDAEAICEAASRPSMRFVAIELCKGESPPPCNETPRNGEAVAPPSFEPDVWTGRSIDHVTGPIRERRANYHCGSPRIQNARH